MSSENRSNSALHKRADQLRRWEQSETCQNISNLKRTSCRISFSDGCVFLAACAAGDKDEVRQLLAKGVDINTSNIDGLTALHQACIDDNLDMVEFLVESGADVNRGDNEGWTPLHATASCGFLSIARYLLDQYADVAAVNNDGELAIDICETNEMADLLQHEIDVRGINCEESRMEEENRLLTDARQWYNDGHVTEVPHPKTGATSVHVAAAKGYVQALSLLLKAGADINAQDFDGWTPLHAAAHWAQREPCQILAENLCNMDIKNYVGQTAFDISDPELLTTLEQLQHKQYAMLKERPEIGHILKRQPVTSFKRRPSAARLLHSERTALVTLDAATERQRLQDHWNECEAALMAAGSPTSTSTTSTSESVGAPSTTVSHPRTAVVSSAAETTPKITDAQLSNVASQEAPMPVPRGGASVPPAPSFTPRPLDGSEGPPTAAVSSDSWRRPAGNNNNSSSGLPAAQLLTQHPSRTVDGAEPAATASTVPSVDPPQSTTPAEQTASATIIQAPSGVSSSPAVRRSFVPPVRDEESETQRKAHAKRVRETRRSTQGVTLEELKSAEQYVKSQQQHQQPHQPAITTTGSLPSSTPSSATTSVPGSSTTAASTGVSGGTTTAAAPSREEMAAAMERRPSWRLRVDDNDRNKFSLEEVRAVSAVAAANASLVGDGDSCLQSTASSASASSSASVASSASASVASSTADVTPSETTTVTLPLRRKSSGGSSAAASAQLQQQQQALQHQQSPSKATSADEDKENDSRSAAATQAAIQRRRKPKRRSTGVVQFGLEENDKGGSTVVAGRNADDAGSATLAAGVAHNDDHSSKASPVPTSAGVENGVVDYKKLYEEAMVDNERLRQRLVAMETEFREAKQQSDKSVQMANSRVAAVESDKRENRALERKLAEMEEELKMMEELRTENRRLRDENGALIRVISKLSK